MSLATFEAARAAPTDDANELRVVFYRDVDDIEHLEPAWSALASSSGQPLFFQSPDWLAQVARIRGEAAGDDWRLRIAGVWHGDRLTAVWPLALKREGLCWIARCLDQPFGQFAGFPAVDDADQDRALDAILDALKTEGMAAGLMIERVIEGSVLHRYLSAKAAKIVHDDRSVVVDFRPFDSFDAYLKTRNAKTRKNLRNARNRLERDHGFDHEVLTASSDLREVMDQAFESRLVWMQDHAKTAPAFRDPSFRRLLDSLPTTSLENRLVGFRLKTGSTPISVQWGFLHAGRYYAFISARNPAFDAYSAGRLHLGMVLEACFERGVHVVELMAPASDYKMNWTDEVRRIDDLGLPLTAAGFLYIELWRRRGRSMMRRLYHGLPEGLRRHVVDTTSRQSTP